MNQKLSRRTLLKSAAVSVPILVSASTLGLADEAAPSERVRVGIIGQGGRGTSRSAASATFSSLVWTMRRRNSRIFRGTPTSAK